MNNKVNYFQFDFDALYNVSDPYSEEMAASEWRV
jgi:hypothetical protein